MPTFRPWDIVKVPFPYVERPIRQFRPALVVGTDPIEDDHGLVWVLMITSAENRRWENDVVVSDLTAAGLPVPSVVRCAKIATIEAKEAALIGSLPDPDRREVGAFLARMFEATGGRVRRSD